MLYQIGSFPRSMPHWTWILDYVYYEESLLWWKNAHLLTILSRGWEIEQQSLLSLTCSWSLPMSDSHIVSRLLSKSHRQYTCFCLPVLTWITLTLTNTLWYSYRVSSWFRVILILNKFCSSTTPCKQLNLALFHCNWYNPLVLQGYIHTSSLSKVKFSNLNKRRAVVACLCSLHSVGSFLHLSALCTNFQYQKKKIVT